MNFYLTFIHLKTSYKHIKRMLSSEDNVIYYGSRQEDFLMFIKGLLTLGNLKSHYIEILTSPASMELYSIAFTAKSANEHKNYEIFELLGDKLVNHCIVWYMVRRFPILKCSDGVEILARLQIKYGAKQSFYEIADRFGFWDFISASEDERIRNKKHLLEDAFEAFLGLTGLIIDEKIIIGSGYAIVYDLVKAIFDTIPISLKYENLCDSKTRLKELFDHLSGRIQYVENRDSELKLTSSMIYHFGVSELEDGKQKFKNRTTKCISKDCKSIPEYGIYELTHCSGHKQENEKYLLRQSCRHCFSNTVKCDHFTPTIIGSVGKASIKIDAQQKAATLALKYLNSMGFVRPIPDNYLKFNSI